METCKKSQFRYGYRRVATVLHKAMGIRIADKKDLEKHIDWYGNVRIKKRLDGSSPVEYRLGRAA